MSDLRIGLIGGTGLGQALGAEAGTRHELDTPFGRPSDAIIETQWAGMTTLILSRHGPGHLLNPSQVPYQANIFSLKQLGCTHILASGAAGSLREEFKPKDLVVPDQLIDKTPTRPGTFFTNAAVHVEFAEPFDATLRQILMDAAKPPQDSGLSTQDFSVHDRGCYVAMEGPAFSTRAESLMHRLMGGDLIGMTAMPEAKLAREAEIPYALLALVTDYDCWRQKPPTAPASEQKADSYVLLKEIMANVHAATENAVKILRRAIELMPAHEDKLLACPARRALELGIWSEKSRIPAAEVERLRPLWGRYFA